MSESQVFRLPVMYIPLTSPCSDVNPILNTSLVAYYPLDDEGLIHYDFTNNRLHFEYINSGPAIDSRYHNSAMKGNYEPADYVMSINGIGPQLPVYQELFSGSYGFTIEFWFYLESNSQSVYPMVGRAGNDLNYGFEITYSKALGRIWCHINENMVELPPLYISYDPPVGEWHHIACADTNYEAPLSLLMIDTDQIKQDAYISYTYTGIFAESMPSLEAFGVSGDTMAGLVVGKRLSTMASLPGSVREFRIWKFARTPNQIIETMHQYISSATSE